MDPKATTNPPQPLPPPPPSSPEKHADYMALPEQFVNNILQILPELVISSIQRVRANEQLEGNKRMSAQRGKFFDSTMKQASENIHKECERKIVSANDQIAENMNALKGLLQSGFKRAQSKVDVASNQEFKALEQMVKDLLSKQKQNEEQIAKQKQEIATLKECVGSQERAAADQSVALKTAMEVCEKLPTDFVELEKQIYDPEKGVAALGRDQACTAKQFEEFKTKTERSIKDVTKSITDQIVDVQECKKLPAELNEFKTEVTNTLGTIRDEFEKAKKEFTAMGDSHMHATVQLENKMLKSLNDHAARMGALLLKLNGVEEDLRSVQESRKVSTDDSNTAMENVSTAVVQELQTHIEDLQRDLKELQTIIVHGFNDDTNGIRFEGVVDRQERIEQSLQHYESIFARADGLNKSVEELKAEVQPPLEPALPSQATESPLKLIERVKILEEKQRHQEHALALRQQGDPQSLDQRIKDVELGKEATLNSVQSISSELNQARKDIDNLMARPQPSVIRPSLSDTAITALKTELQSDMREQFTLQHQEIAKELANTNADIPPLRKAIHELLMCYEKLSATQLTQETANRLCPDLFAACDRTFGVLQNSLVNMGKDVVVLQKRITQSNFEIQSVKLAQAASKCEKNKDRDA
jgi:hypothetical protein